MILMGGNTLGAESLTAPFAFDPLSAVVAVGIGVLVWGLGRAGARVWNALRGATVPRPALAFREAPQANATLAEILAEWAPGPRDMDRLDIQIDWRRIVAAPTRPATTMPSADLVDALDALARGDVRVLARLAASNTDAQLSNFAQDALAHAAGGNAPLGWPAPPSASGMG
jgi:hypothetical protein